MPDHHRLPPASIALRYSLGDWAACLVLLSIGLYLDKAKPFEQYIGNRLKDPSISYPHTPPAQQQVTANQLIYIALVVPGCIIAATQPVLRRRRVGDLNQAWLGLLSSVALALTLVCIVKNGVGRLRPDFLARCRPVGTGEHAACSNPGPEVIEGRKSFPSGHSALSMAGMAYLSFWLGAKLAHTELPALALAGNLWKVMVASTPWLFALWVGLSRLEDYWHHWEDVYANRPAAKRAPLARARARARDYTHGRMPVRGQGGRRAPRQRVRLRHVPAALPQPRARLRAQGGSRRRRRRRATNESQGL